MISLISKIPIRFLGEIFVDNTDLFTMLPDIVNTAEALPIAQENLDKWAHLLIATGGALNPSKYYWYMVYYRCQNGQWEYRNTIQHRLTIPLPGGDCKAILQLPVMEERKMLGVWSSPTGLGTKHLQEVVLGKNIKMGGKT